MIGPSPFPRYLGRFILGTPLAYLKASTQGVVMKLMTVFLLLAFAVTGSAFAQGETSTECPMMREMNERNNPKANLGNVKVKSKKGTGAVKQ